MKLLCLESSAGPASCAVIEDGRVLASAVLNTAMTHSQTLLPMVEDMLKNACLTLKDIGAVAVSAGPGSFTGVRIAIATVKGIAFAGDLPCIPVSTLEAMALQLRGLPFDGVICAAMDARCKQTYTACFLCKNGEIERLTPDEAIAVEELKGRLAELGQPVLFVGDGAQLCFDSCRDVLADARLAPEPLRRQQAVGVGFAAESALASGEICTAAELLPRYLRLPQAERELRARQNSIV